MTILAYRLKWTYYALSDQLVFLARVEQGVRLMKKTSGSRPLLFASVMAATLTGCMSMAPDYVRPQAPVPEAYPAMTGEQDRPVADAALAWRDFFTDPVLQQLIVAALEHNHDLRLALLRVEEARAAFGIQRSERVPDLGVAGQAARSRLPADLGPAGRSMVGSEYRVEVGLTSWELDLWGRVRSLEQAALESWLATEAAGRAVHIALLAQVANTYLGLRELEQRVTVTRETVRSRERSYQIFQRRYAAGATAKLEVTQVLTLLTQAQVLLAQLEQEHAVQTNALRQLAGDRAVSLLQQHSLVSAVALAELEPGLPSALLTSRPDIMAAEHRLRAANANIGAARAAYFPRIALTGSFGSASSELNGLFESGSKAWAFAPTVSLPIFDGGRRRASLEMTRVRRDMAVTEYQDTIQTAFREVADALAGYHWLTEQLAARLQARDAQAERIRLAQLRYDNGSAAYLEVLDAQRDLLDAEQQLASTERALLSSQVALYRALGGGSQPEQPSSAGSAGHSIESASTP